MIKFTFKADDKETGEVLFPSNWHEVTTRQYIDLRTNTATDPAKLLEILSGVPREVWMKMSPDSVDIALSGIDFIIKDNPGFDKMKVPDQIKVNDKEIVIPKDLGLSAFAQKMLIDQQIQQLIALETKNKDMKKKQFSPIKLVDYIAGVYLQPLIFGGEFDSDKLDEAVMHVGNTPAYLIYPIAGFFLKKSLDSMTIAKKLSRPERRKIQRKTNPSRKKPDSKN